MAVVLAGKIHYLGGKSGGVDVAEHDVYDPATKTWVTAAPMPTARDHAAGAVVDGRIYIAGGRPHDLTLVQAYDPGANRWTTLPPLPLGRSAVAGASFDHRFVVLGGEHPAEQSVDSEVDAYDPGTRRWSRLPDLPSGRQGIGAAVVGDTLYLPGGGPTGGGSRQSDTLLLLS